PTSTLSLHDALPISMLPKSITTPVAMQMAEAFGGIPSLAAVYVMVAGFTGILVGPWLLKTLHIDSPIGRGIGLGSSAHGLGTARSEEHTSELQSREK